MNTTKGTTARAVVQGTSNGVGESFRVLYYGSAAAGSVPFKWESQPGTPKHTLTESSLPTLTPPPSYHKYTQKYNSSKRSGFLSNIFLASSWKRNIEAGPMLSLSSSSVSSSSSSHLHSWQATPMSKTKVKRVMSMMKIGLEDDCGEQGCSGGGSPASTRCKDGGFKRSYRTNKMKKAIQWFVRHGKA